MWYTIVSWGGAHSGGHRMPPRGPWRTQGEAQDALDRWGARLGSEYGTVARAHNVRIAGPFSTRAEAKRADISMALPYPPR